MGDQYVSVDDAASELGVTRTTMWKWIKRFEVQTFRILGNRRTMVRRSDVERLRQPMPTEEAKKLVA